MLNTASSNAFLNSKSISLKPMVFAEWNQNLYGYPYTTVAGTGVKETNLTEISTLTTETGVNARENFTTKKFIMNADEDTIEYAIDLPGTSSAYKIITFIKTNSATPIVANIYVQGDPSQFGSSSVEINSSGWKKVETYVGGSSSVDYIPDLSYIVSLNRLSTEDALPIDIYFTEPEVYPISFFNYQYNSLWPTESPFTNFRPGESYVNTGSSLFSFPENYRVVTNEIIDGYTDDVYIPVTPIIHNPSFYNVAPPVPFYKDNMINDMCNYKYFVSDTSNKSITAFYEGSGVMANKLVLKFNTLMAVPTVTISINGSAISINNSTSITLDLDANKEDGGVREDAGVLILYWNGAEWTRSRWTEMPVINNNGNISKVVNITKITITQTANTKRSGFISYTSTDFIDDATRMQLIEVSPRVEVDLTPFLIDLSVNKSMDSKSSLLPISPLNANDATITLASIPLGTQPSPITIFSNQSNSSSTVLKNILRKNIKMYTFFYLEGYHDSTNSKYISSNTLIPAGIFYSDTWSETDINQVVVQCYDTTRYLQSTQVADYVCNLRQVVDVITNMLDLSGFTDYDYDSLHKACYNPNSPVDVAYFYVNSKDTTIVDALNQICLPYQIGCYIDEYGILKFLSLADIVNPSFFDPQQNENIIEINESVVNDGGYSIVNKGKPGKISIKYEIPLIKQSGSAQNLSSEKVGGNSFILLSSNEVVWSQQNTDSVGMNFLNQDMDESQNFFQLDNNDVLDIFHTYNRNANGYAVIENEIVSFLYKEYSIQDDNNNIVNVAVKNDMELEAEKGRFVKKHITGLKTGDGNEKPEEPTQVQHTGKILNIERGLFGSKVASHRILTSTNANSKHIKHKILSPSYVVTGDATLHSSTIDKNEFVAITPTDGRVIFYPQHERSTVATESGLDYYKTYSAKFNLTNDAVKSSGGVFFNMTNSETTAEGAYFVELVKYNTYGADGTANSPFIFNYAIVVYRVVSGLASIIAYCDITPTVSTIIENQEKVLEKETAGDEITYIVKSDPRYEYFNLRVATYKSKGSDNDGSIDGENTSIINLLEVFLNNIQISGWKVFNGSAWVPIPLNSKTGIPKKIQYSNSISPETIFGAFVSAAPVQVPGITYQSTFGLFVGGVREIYATHKPLIERSVNYYFQDRDFLNGLIQNLKTFSKSPSYMMQTKPEVVGINVYDVEYKTPAAINVDVWPVSYLLQYIPEKNLAAQQFRQKKEVDEYSLSYSTILNTGFRARFAIVNNTSHLVLLHYDATDLVTTNVRLNLWTTEIVANADTELIEKVVDPGNAAEVVQINSKWIQSKDAANKLMSTMANAVDNFSKDLSLSIFGNPTIQVGDVINLNYPLMGVKDQKYFVTSVSHDFNNGLSTNIGLNMLSRGTEY